MENSKNIFKNISKKIFDSFLLQTNKNKKKIIHGKKCSENILFLFKIQNKASISIFGVPIFHFFSVYF